MSGDLSQAIALIKRGWKAEARPILIALLKSDPHNESAWLRLVETMSTDAEREATLEQCLKANPESVKARQALESLKSRPETPAARETATGGAQGSASQPDLPAPGDAPESWPAEPSGQLPLQLPEEASWDSLSSDRYVAPEPAAPFLPERSPAFPEGNKSPPHISRLEAILIGVLVVMALGAAGFFGREILQRQTAARSAAATQALPPVFNATRTPDAALPSGPGLLFFSGADGCSINWISAQGGEAFPAGTLPDELCTSDASHWTVKRWSPDGTLIAAAVMEASPDGSAGTYSIQIVHSDGRPAYTVITGSGAIPPAGLAWAPDGHRLAYAAPQETGSGGVRMVLRVIPVDGRSFGEEGYLQLTWEPISLEDAALPGQHMAWSPDGTSLALSAVTGRQNGLFLAKAQESAYNQLAGDLAGEVSVSWSPDGRRIAYNDGPDWKVTFPDGEALTVVSGDSSREVFCIAWTPDSAELICTVQVHGGAQQLIAFRTNGSGEWRILVEDAPLFEQTVGNAQWQPGKGLLAVRDMEDQGLYIFDVVEDSLLQLRVETGEDFGWGRP